MNKTVIAFAFATIAASALAQAPGGGAFTPPTFDGLDTDKNGSLSQDEVSKWVTTTGRGNAGEVFGRWDANKDGSVSKAEFDARPRPQGPGGGGPPGAGGPAPGGPAPR